MGRIASLDFGTSRIGLAVSDPLKMIASPLPTLSTPKSLKESVNHVLESLKDYTLELMIVGMPLNMDGTKGSQAQLVEKFIEELRSQTACPIQEWDERLTSAQADRMMKEDHLSRKKRAKGVDALSAVLILQSYLDSH